MRYAILSDIHGNAEALDAVLNDIGEQSIDSIICLGDIVGYYPDPEKCLELIKENVDFCVAGNHDYAAIGRIDTQNFTYYAFRGNGMDKTEYFTESQRLSQISSAHD